MNAGFCKSMHPGPERQMVTRCGQMPLVAVLGILATACAGARATPTTAAAPPQPAGELVVLAAASLSDAFAEIGQAFQEAHPGVTVTFDFAASQQLAQQLGEGAPADVFASANQRQMQVAIDGGRIATGSAHVFVRNRLLIVFPADNPARIVALQDLAEPGLRLVLVASEAPAGQYTLEFLDNASADPAFGASFRDEVLANVVSYEETVRSVLSKVLLGEADAGIVYSSDAAGQDAAQLGRLEIPDGLNVIAEYPIAPVADSTNPGLAAAFVDFVLSPQGQAVLTDHGFAPAPFLQE
jgi:molybdate transport system substrate-binding protein